MSDGWKWPVTNGNLLLFADASKPDPPDVLNKQKCLEALASLRHAKWFQVGSHSQFGCDLIRI